MPCAHLSSVCFKQRWRRAFAASSRLTYVIFSRCFTICHMFGPRHVILSVPNHPFYPKLLSRPGGAEIYFHIDEVGKTRMPFLLEGWGKRRRTSDTHTLITFGKRCRVVSGRNGGRAALRGCEIFFFLKRGFFGCHGFCGSRSLLSRQGLTHYLAMANASH